MIHDKEEFTKALLNWYDKHARILPWRSKPTPYRVWVSEIMLQQTRVEAVKPYFDRFLKALPTLKDLAEVEDDELAKLWEGLGYYNRVRNMKKCAQQCMNDFDGNLPSTYDELLSLPGIGPYTAGAIASIAFKQCVPAIDGNVLRVFSRVLISEDDILKDATKKKFQSIVQEYIPEDRSDAFNQALMEIGAMVCVPNAAPRCNVCPLASNCLGYQSGQAQRLPNKTAKKKRCLEKKTIVLLVHNQQVVIHQRLAQGLLAGLYEFTCFDKYYTKAQMLEELSDRYKCLKISKLATSKHIFSHIEWHMQGYLVEVAKWQGNELLANFTQLKHTYAIPTAYKVYRDFAEEYLEEEANEFKK